MKDHKLCKAVYVDGVRFGSQKAAAKHIGVSPSTLSLALSSGGKAGGRTVSRAPAGSASPPAEQRTELALTTRDILADAAQMLLASGRIEDAARVLEMAVTA